jgi:hypothetical protein
MLVDTVPAVGGRTVNFSLSRRASLRKCAGALSQASVCLSIGLSDARVCTSLVLTAVSYTRLIETPSSALLSVDKKKLVYIFESKEERVTNGKALRATAVCLIHVF